MASHMLQIKVANIYTSFRNVIVSNHNVTRNYGLCVVVFEFACGYCKT